jgi:uncharacterized protein (TIGR00369 family)
MAEDESRLHEVTQRMDRSVFHHWAGTRLARTEAGEVEIELEIESHHLNPFGLLHGGMIATLADTAMGYALRTRMEPDTTHVTAQLSIAFLRPAREGRVSAIGRAIKSGRTTGYAEADVVDAGGRLLARATGTFIVLREEGDHGTGRFGAGG